MGAGTGDVSGTARRARGARWLLPALAIVILAWLAVTYRAMPWTTPDTGDYLDLLPHRPVGYGAVLHAVQALGLGPSLRFLPQVQGAVLLGALVAFAGVLRRATGSLAVGLAVLLLPWLLPAFATLPVQIMTEPLFMAATLGAAALCLARPGAAALLALGACLGAAILLRTAGFAVAAAVLAFLALHVRPGRRGFALVLAPLLAAWLLGAAAQAGLNGRFALGSFGGASLAGKGALLADGRAPLPDALRGLPEAAAEARTLIAAAPHRALADRLRLQAYEDLRYRWIWPRAEAGLPGWDPADPTTWSALAGRVALDQIRADPGGYARLVLQDYLALFTWPELAGPATLEADRAFLAAQPRRVVAAACDETGSAGCWPVLPAPAEHGGWRLVLPLSLLALPLSLGVLAAAALGAARIGRGAPAVLLLPALLIQAQAAATALAEGGLLRYATVTLPFVVALAAAAALLAARRLARGTRGTRRGAG